MQSWTTESLETIQSNGYDSVLIPRSCRNDADMHRYPTEMILNVELIPLYR